MAVRSTRLFGPSVVGSANTWVSLYTVPTSRTARFSLITLVHTSGAARVVAVGVGQASIGGSVWYKSMPTVTSESVLQGLILRPADQLYALCDVASVLYVSGFGSLLLGAPA